MIILSGSHTPLGACLLPMLRDSHQVCAFDDGRGDIRDFSFVESHFREIKPDLFINCAQMDNVEECEYKREDAYTLNGRVPAFLATLCAASKAAMVQLSSHYVFPGTGNEPYREDSASAPATVFGDSKDYAEKRILSSGCEHLIVRFPHLYGRSGWLSGYLEKMKAGESVTHLKDEMISPTYTLDAARMLIELIDRGARGIVHCANEGTAALPDFLYEVERHYSRSSGRGLVVNLKGLEPDEFISPCDLPVNNTLDISKLRSLGIAPRHWKEALEEFISSNHQYL